MNKLLLIFFLALAGAEPNRLNQQILRGRDCNKTEALYHVAVCKEPCTSVENIICGGTLIRSQWVLTAAHCAGPLFNQFKLKVVLNAQDVSHFNSSDVNNKIKPNIIKEKFLHQDIMLLKLNQSVPANKTFIREPNENECKNFELQNMTFSISGLGAKLYTLPNGTKCLHYPMILQCSQIPKVPCPKNFNVNGILSNNRFCAGGQGEDTLNGDSGGGLVNNNVVYGVVHAGYYDLTGNTPGIYMNVCKFLDWIKDNAK